MPTYEYQCTKCDRVFELFQSITAKPKRTIGTECDQCNNKAPVTRLIGTGAGILFKGSGFYETDYRSESYKAGQKAEKDATSKKDESKKDSSKGPKKDASGGATMAKKTKKPSSGDS